MESELRTWLTKFGLDQYADRLIASGIGLRQLSELSEQQLSGLGFSSDHASALRRHFSYESSSHDRPDAAGQSMLINAERRLITVMFIDLVDSTGLSRRLDPEELLDVIVEYQNTVCKDAEVFGGHLARLVGDGVLMLFGWPFAFENNAERAIRSALASLDSIRKMNELRNLKVECRIGIASGNVVVGDFRIANTNQTDSVFGETPNLAERLQHIGDPNMIVVSELTRRLAGELFEYVDLGNRSLKGFETPVPAFQVIREIPNRGRFEATHLDRLLPIAGRAEELEHLERCLAEAEKRRGQVVWISGEAGIGKSRLLREARRLAGERSFIPIRYQCSPFHTQSPYYPLIKQLERAAGIVSKESADNRREKMDMLLRKQHAATTEQFALLTEAASLPPENSDLLSGLSGRERKRKTEKAFFDLLKYNAERSPVLLLFEDMHWADPSTLDLVNRAINELSELPIAALLSCRSEFRHQPSRKQHVTVLHLQSLEEDYAARMINNLTIRQPLADDLVASIIEATGGNPLFIEECTKAVCDAQTAGPDGDMEVARQSSTLPVFPLTLQDTLMERLDRLDSAREFAQVSSVIGREFEPLLLTEVVGATQDDVDSALEQLADAGILVGNGSRENRSFRFRHILIQDAAYRSLLKKHRKDLHGKIAAAFEELFPEIVEAEPEFLARHLTDAEVYARAIDFWQLAAKRNLDRFAVREAAEHALQGVRLVENLPDPDERDRVELELQQIRGEASRASAGFGSTTTMEAYHRVADLAMAVGNERSYRRAVRGLFNAYYARAQYETAHSWGERYVEIARDPYAKMVGHHMIGVPLLWQGKFVAARSELEESLSHYDEQQISSYRPKADSDSPVQTLAPLSIVLAMLGYPDQSLATGRQAISMARQLELPLSVANAYVCLCNANQIIRRPESHDIATEFLRYASEHDLPFYVGSAQAFVGLAMYRMGKIEEGFKKLQNGWELFKSTKSRVNQVFFHTELAEGCKLLGRTEEGLKAADRGLELAEKYGERNFEAELLRLRGELLLQLSTPDLEGAEIEFVRGLQVARTQQAKFFELRLTNCISRLHIQRGQLSRAAEPLKETFSWFDEGVNLPDLDEARNLIDQLQRDAAYLIRGD